MVVVMLCWAEAVATDVCWAEAVATDDYGPLDR